MEKTMQLVECSFKKQREWTRQDGTKETVDYYEVTLTDGIDTIYGETVGTLTKQIAKEGEDRTRVYGALHHQCPQVRQGGQVWSVRFGDDPSNDADELNSGLRPSE